MYFEPRRAALLQKLHLAPTDADALRELGELYAEGERWAELMQHAFALDVLQCPHCPGRLVYIATIRSAQVAQAILRSLGRDTERPSPASPRDPPSFWSALHGDVDHVA